MTDSYTTRFSSALGDFEIIFTYPQSDVILILLTRYIIIVIPFFSRMETVADSIIFVKFIYLKKPVKLKIDQKVDDF